MALTSIRMLLAVLISAAFQPSLAAGACHRGVSQQGVCISHEHVLVQGLPRLDRRLVSRPETELSSLEVAVREQSWKQWIYEVVFGKSEVEDTDKATNIADAESRERDREIDILAAELENMEEGFEARVSADQSRHLDGKRADGSLEDGSAAEASENAEAREQAKEIDEEAASAEEVRQEQEAMDEARADEHEGAEDGFSREEQEQGQKNWDENHAAAEAKDHAGEDERAEDAFSREEDVSREEKEQKQKMKRHQRLRRHKKLKERQRLRKQTKRSGRETRLVQRTKAGTRLVQVRMKVPRMPFHGRSRSRSKRIGMRIARRQKQKMKRHQRLRRHKKLKERQRLRKQTKRSGRETRRVQRTMAAPRKLRQLRQSGRNRKKGTRLVQVRMNVPRMPFHGRSRSR